MPRPFALIAAVLTAAVVTTACGSSHTPSATPTTPPASTAAPSGSPSASASTPAATTAPPATQSPSAGVTATPSGSSSAVAAKYVAPAVAGTQLVGCTYDGKYHWTVTFRVTVRGGSGWAFAGSSAQTMPYIFTIASIKGNTVTYKQSVQWTDVGRGVPTQVEEDVRYYGLLDKADSKKLGIELPLKYQLTAHCSR